MKGGFRKFALMDMAFLGVYAVVGLVSVRKLVNHPGTIGLRHDWPIPGAPFQLHTYIWQTFGVWDSTVGQPIVYPSLNYFKLIEWVLVGLTGANPGLYSKVLVAILVTSTGIGFYVYARSLALNRIAGFIGGLFFMLSPVVFNRIIAGHILYLFSMALAPFIVAILVWGFRSGWRRQATVLAGLTYGVAWAQLQFAFLIPGIVLIVLFGMYLEEKMAISTSRIKEFSAQFVGFQLIGALLHFYWLLPFATGFRTSFSLGEVSTLSYHEIVNGPSTAEALFGIGYPHGYAYANILTNAEMPFVLGALAVILAIGALSLFFDGRIIISVASATILIIGVFLLAGTNGPLPDFWRYLFRNFPVMGTFREVYHFAFLPVFATASLLACSVDGLLRRRGASPFTTPIVIVLFLLVATAGSPVLSGNFHDQVQTYQYPHGTNNVLSDLAEDERDIRVLYLPSLNPISFESTRYPGVDPSIRYSPKATFPQLVSDGNPLSLYHRYTIRQIRQEHMDGTAQRLGLLSVDRVIWRPTAQSRYPEYVTGITADDWDTDFSDVTQNISEIHEVEEDGEVITFDLAASRSFVRADGSYVVAYGGQNTLKYAASANGPPVILLPSPNVGNDRIFNHSAGLYTEDSLVPLLFGGPRSQAITFPATASNPAHGWAEANSSAWWSSSVYWDIPIQYRDEYVQTSAVRTLSSAETSSAPVSTKTEFSVAKQDEYLVFGHVYSAQDGGTLTLEIANKSIDISTRGHTDSMEWGQIGSVYLEKGTHEAKLANRQGNNVVSHLVIIPRQEFLNRTRRMDAMISDAQIIFRFEAERAFKRSGNVEESQQEDAVLLRNRGELKKEVLLPRSGKYRIAINGSGPVVVRFGNWTMLKHIEDTAIVTPPRSSTGREFIEITVPSQSVFSSSFEGELNASEPLGTYEMRLVSTGGRNDTRLRVTTTSNHPTWSWIRTQSVDVSAGEEYMVSTNMMYENVNDSHIVLEGFNVSTDQWQQINQIPDGQTGTKGWTEYHTQISIPRNISKVRFALNAGWVENPEEGNAITWFDDLRIEKSEESRVDEVWLYTTPTNPSNQTFQGVLESDEDPATIKSYKKSNPAEYKVSVNASGPYMLSFAEAYDPLWVAEIQTENGSKQIEPTPLYGVINGFWIEHPGEYTVTIRYRPLRWFNYGAVVSGTTITLFLAYLLYGWRRRRKDEWTVRVHARWSTLIRRSKGVINKGLR